MIIGGTEISMYPGVLHLGILSILLVVRLLIFFYFQNKRFNSNRNIGTRSYIRLTKATLRGTKLDKNNLDLNMLVQGSKLFVGDIIRLKKYDIVPADCIVIAASDKKFSQYVCFVDNILYNGQLSREQKSSLELTRSFTPLTQKEATARQFIKRITGKVVISQYNKKKDSFSGSIKLKSDPKVEKLSNKNLLKRGSIIRSRYVYGLVVLAGYETSILKNERMNYGKRSSIHNTVTIYSVITICANIVLSLVSIMTLFVRTQDNQVLTTLDPNLVNGFRVFTFVILYSPIVPISMLIMIEISNIIYCFQIEMTYRNYANSANYSNFLATKSGQMKRRNSTKLQRLTTNVEEKNEEVKKESEKDSLRIFNANILPDLGCTDHVFFDKTGTLVTDTYEIITVASTQKIYKSEDNNFLNDGLKKEIDDFNTNNNGYQSIDEDSGVFSEGSRKSVISNPHYNFTIKMSSNNPLSSISSRIQNTETDQLIDNNRHSQTTAGVNVLVATEPREKVQKTEGPVSKATKLFNGKTNGHIPAPQKKRVDIWDNIYDEYDFFKDTIRDKEVTRIMQMFTMCHNSIPSGDSFESHSIEEKAMLMFSKHFGFTFSTEAAFKKQTTFGGDIYKRLKVKSGKNAPPKNVDIMVINEADDRGRFSVLVKNKKNNGSTLYVRGLHQSMREIINFEDGTSSYDQIVKYNGLKGLNTFVYGKKEMGITQTKKYVEDFNKYRKKLLDQKVNLRKLAIQMENKLQLVCLIGVKNKCRRDAEPVINTLKEMGVRISIMTGDDLTHARMAANVLKIFEKEDTFHFDFIDVESGVTCIKDVLEKIKKITVGKKKAGANNFGRASTSVSGDELMQLNQTQVVFSGRAWRIMKGNKYLHSHFLFICKFARNMIGYGMTSTDKAKFVKHFRNSNTGNKKVITCIGDGFNDIGMLQEADIGIQIKSKFVDIVYGDIYVDNLAVIPAIMRKEGAILFSNLKQTIFIFFGQTVGLAMINFFYQFFASFTGAPLLNIDMLQLNYVLLFINGLLFVLWESKFSNKIIERFPAFYMQKMAISKRSLINFLYEMMLTAIESIFILCFTLFSYNDQRNEQGLVGNMHMVSISISLANQFLTSFKFVMRSNMSTSLMFIVTVLQTLIMLSLIAVLDGLIFFKTAFSFAGREIYSHYNALFVLLASTLLSCLFSWSMWEVVLRKMRYPILCDVENRVKNGDLNFLVERNGVDPNKNYLDLFNDNESFSTVVSSCFTDNQSKPNNFYSKTQNFEFFTFLNFSNF